MTRAQEEPEEVVEVEMLAHLAVEMVPLAQQTQAAVVVVEQPELALIPLVEQAAPES